MNFLLRQFVADDVSPKSSFTLNVQGMEPLALCWVGSCVQKTRSREENDRAEIENTLSVGLGNMLWAR